MREDSDHRPRRRNQRGHAAGKPDSSGVPEGASGERLPAASGGRLLLEDLAQERSGNHRPGPVAVSYTHLTLPTIYSV